MLRADSRDCEPQERNGPVQTEASGTLNPHAVGGGAADVSYQRETV